MAPMESQGWRKKSTVTVLYSYSYPVSNSTGNSSQDDGNEVSMREGERLILLEKSNTDWWQVRRPGDKSQPFYAPANYLQEDGISKAKKSIPPSQSSFSSGESLTLKFGHNAINPSGHNKLNANRRHVGVSSATSASVTHLNESRSDDCLQISSRQQQQSDKSSSNGKWSIRQAANSELRKQRSTSMDAIMFLELLENEIKDMPGGSGATGDVTRKGKSHNSENIHNRSSSSIGRQLKSESLVDRFKKPRISKDLWERRKSWAVEESTPPPSLHLMGPSSRRPPLKEEETANINPKHHHQRRSMQSLLAAPPLPPRLSAQQENQSSLGRLRDKTSISRRECSDAGDADKNIDKAPALPPKRNPSQGAVVASPVVTSSPVRPAKVDNYSRVIPLRSAAGGSNNHNISIVSAGANSSAAHSETILLRSSPPSSLVTHNRVLSESLEKLAQQIQTPLSYPHPIPPPRRSSSESMERSAGNMGQSSSTSPPRLPPKNAKPTAVKPNATTPTTSKTTYATVTTVQQQKQTPYKLSNSALNTKNEVKDNYVNLMRPVTLVDTLDDIQSDESGINMSFNNPLFSEKEDGQEKGSQEQLGSSVDLESSIDDAISLKAVKISRGSESNLSCSELEANYASSTEDILSSKDSLNSIPSVQSDHSRSKISNNNNNNTSSLTKPPPDSPGPRQRPKRELFENWFEYVDQTSGRPFYYNTENRAKSWKPPRRIGTSPITRGISIEEEKFDDGDQLSSSVDSHHSSTTSHQSRLASKAVMEAQAANRTLLAVPPGWIESTDTSTDEVVYINTSTGAREGFLIGSGIRLSSIVVDFYPEKGYGNLWFADKWYTSLDSENRVYFYEEDSNESMWALPQITSVPALTLSPEMEPVIQQGVFYPEGSKLSPKMNEQKPVASVPTSKWDLVRQRTSKSERNSKTRSMVLTNFSGCVEDIAVENVSREASRVTLSAPTKTASLPRNIQPQWPNLQGGSIVSDYLTNLDIRVLQQGVLHKTKLTENGKKIRKNWTSSWVVLTDLFLFLFKESTAKMSAAATGSPAGTNKPELCVDLNGATIEWAAVKSSRKGVFQVSTLLGVQLLLQDEDETNAVVWFNEIKRAIQRLPCGTKETTNHYPSPFPSPLIGSKPKKLSLETKNFSPEFRHKRNDSQNFLTPPSPDVPVSFSNNSSLIKQGSKKNRLGRTKSTKVPFLGSTEDLTSVAPGSSPERQKNLRDKLRRFFVRRPTVDSLVRKGIWKDEPVFGCHLSALCHADESTVPKFVQQVIQLIESKLENMKADGIYRASGNLSQIQKIRCQVDQYNWAILEIEDDVHVLTGCLKLFFRELKEPLIPCPLFERALQATNYQGPNPERIRRYRDIIESLPTENYDTLQYLLRHLLKITEYREHNRMHISNLAIVFGPTLMWAATVSNNLALDMMQQNLVVEALLNNYHNIFNR